MKTETHDRCAIDDDTAVLVLTGAGVSAESGVPTFRGAGGYWDKYRLEDLASPAAFERDPGLVWRFYGGRRAAAAAVEPNAGHHALVELEKRLGDRFLLATQNVDGLHRRAGSQRVFELHGQLFASRCSRCDRAPFDDDATYTHGGGPLPTCDECSARGEPAYLRPHIVWFGEALDGGHLGGVQRFLEAGSNGRLVFLAAGTSGAVYPAAGFVDLAARYGAETWLVNMEPADNVGRFDHYVQGLSGSVLPTLFAG